MLTSSNQYLRPEYLTPLPTTLDAKKSPLALLAQTCSQIGADPCNSKLLQSTDKINKTTKFDTDKEKFDSNSTEYINKLSSKNELNSAQEKSRTPEESSSCGSTICRVNTPLTTKVSSNGRCSSSQSVNSPCTSPDAAEYKTSPENNAELINSSEKANHGATSLTSSPGTSKTAFTPNILTSSSDPSIKDLPLGTFKPSLQPATSSFLGGYSTGFPVPVDIMTSTLIPQNHTLKSGVISSYLGYGRMKTQESLSSVCRDPYCAGCSVGSHLIGASNAGKTISCPAGCAQCDHSKAPTSSGYMSHNSAATVYAHAQLAALAAASHLPYVCNWISGDATYCGKRFSNSDELLSHLRTHTSAAVSETNSSLSMLSSTVLPPTHSFLPRTYPTPPLSPLTTARYHPYSKPSLIHPSLSSPSLNNFAINHPSLSPYLSPYSLYGPRIGTAPGMHP
ncbi:zinc finger protein Elbow-like [Anoplophora glabripennis]|uniref:zinc finger protein Elbow-like n=1 Tax=Anoplophora glabripennis TaxID=217634 RepID=UPI000873E877|nr:zinc finger protein Elbow-like [Anoplophora glabripennis]